MSYDLVIVGSGITGLASAIFGAKNDKKCLLIEKCPYLGGAVRGFYKDNIYYPYGVSLLGSLNDGELMDLFFEYMGISDKIELKEFQNKEIFTFINNKYEKLSIPSDQQKLLNTLSEKFPEDKEKLEKFFNSIDEVIDSNFFYKLKFEDTSKSHMLEFFLNSDDILWERIKDFSPQLRQILESFLFLFGVFSADTPFFVFALIVGSYLRGTKYINKGGIQLVNALESELNKLGVDIRKNERVTRIKCEKKKFATSVITDKNEYETKNIIFTGEPNTLTNLIDEKHLTNRFINRINNYEVGMSIFGAYYKVDESVKIEEEDHYRNYIYYNKIPKNYDEFKNLSIENKFDSALNILTNYDNGKFQIYCLLAQNYKHFIKYKNDRGEEYQQLKKKIERAIRNKVESIFPKFKNNLKPVVVFTPLTIVDYLEHTEGSVFGLYASTKQKGINAIFPFTPIKNLFLSGQNIVLPGVLGSLVSVLLGSTKIYGKKLFDELKTLRKNRR